MTLIKLTDSGAKPDGTADFADYTDEQKFTGRQF
jgi:hypothetical protein